MNHLFSPLSKKAFFLIFSVILSQGLLSQNLTAVWDLLLLNKRTEALEQIAKVKDTTTIDYLVARQLIKEDNGFLTPDNHFLNALVTHPDFEYYLYALWAETFVFSDYVSSGFNEYSMVAVDKLKGSNIKNTSIRLSMDYITAAKALHLKDWNSYKTINQKINAVRDWEFCGVFENINNSGLSIAYEPETNPSNKAVFNTNNYGLTQWYVPSKQTEPYYFFSNHDEFSYEVNYAQTFVEVANTTEGFIRVGRGGSIRVWLNDVLIYEDDKDISTDIDAASIPVTFLKGNNRILVKLASEKQQQYFAVRLEDANGQPLSYTHNFSSRNYPKGEVKSFESVITPHPAVVYFKNLKATQTNNFLVDYLLFLSYLRNSDYITAKEVINPWVEKYPNSSFLKNGLIAVHTYSGDNDAVIEIRKNIENNDPDYYISYLYKFLETNKLFNEDKATFEKTVRKIGNATDLNFMKEMADFLILARDNQLDSLKSSLERLIDDPYLFSNLKSTFAQYFARLNDEEKTIKMLESFYEETFDYDLINSLSYYYKKRNEKDKSLGVYQIALENFKHDNNVLYDYVNRLIEFEKYDESLDYIERAIKNFPYSSTFQKLKGDVLVQLNDKNGALKSYKEALDRDPTNKGVRKKIVDLLGEEDIIEKIRIKDSYQYIEENRGKIAQNNYGINILLDESNVVVYEKGGGRYKATYIYEVTSQKGIESLKEYDLDLSGDYNIVKSEIVKPDKSIVPADRSGSSFVFNKLSVGDVILLDFESSFSNTGRFYKDYSDLQSFESYHPYLKKIYRILSKENKINHKVVNGTVDFKTYKKGDYQVYDWSITNAKELNDFEDFMPAFDDVAKTLHISTISNWKEISNWYSDLVRSQMLVDAEVRKVLKEIFPDGYQQFSKDERVEKIYDYVTGDFTYSHVSFKQSGFVPQKPSKTITTKLGDCKDFSTLFVTLAKEVEVEAQLVLILTSDYGKTAVVLPNTDFNHCIVKTTYNGQPQYLELTDKYLPFRALPTSLFRAIALDIPYQRSDATNDIYHLSKKVSRVPSVFNNNAIIEVSEDSSKIQLTTQVSGQAASYYISLFDETNHEVLKTQVFDDLSQRSEADLTLNKLEVNHVDTKTVEFTLDLLLNKKTTKIGSLKTFIIPFFSTPYTQNIINLEKRNYPINYNSYETIDEYKEHFVIKLPEENQFVELPENKTLTFKNHTCSISYNLVKPNELVIDLETFPGSGDVLVEEYQDFKNFIREVLEIREQIIAFK